MFVRRSGFLGQVLLVPYSGHQLGQATQDPVVLAKVNLAEAYGDAVTAVSRVVQVTPEAMAASPESARLTFESFLKNPSFISYAMKLLVLSAVIVRENIRALGMEPQQLLNVLMGAEEAVKKVIPAEALPAQLKKYQEEVVSRAPANIQNDVRKLVEGSGIAPDNLVPNIPEGTSKQPFVADAGAPGLSDLEKVALIGVPVILLAAIGIMAR